MSHVNSTFHKAKFGDRQAQNACYGRGDLEFLSVLAFEIIVSLWYPVSM